MLKFWLIFYEVYPIYPDYEKFFSPLLDDDLSLESKWE